VVETRSHRQAGRVERALERFAYPSDDAPTPVIDDIGRREEAAKATKAPEFSIYNQAPDLRTAF
jgi:hypothetical protein